MNEKTFEAIYDLKSVLAKDKRVLELNETEKSLLKDNQVASVRLELDNLINEFEDISDVLGEDSNEAKAILKRIHEKKYELDVLHSSKEYTDKFIKVRDLYLQINQIIFSPFKEADLGNKKC